MALTNLQIKSVKPKDRDFKLYDEKGLFLLVRKNGSKYWRFKYRFRKTEKLLALGVYPEVSLKEARCRRDAARKKITEGLDPGFVRKIERAGGSENTFRAVAEEFLENNSSRWSASHKRRVKECFERDVYPWIGPRPLKDLTAVEVLTTLRRIVDRGAVETAARTKQFIGQAIRYGIATGRAERDVTQDLRGALPSPAKGHYHAITDSRGLARLLRDIDNYQGSFVVRTALKLQPMLFVRPANLVMMEWEEIDLDAQEWRIPGAKMKVRDRHIVPLPDQAVEILKDIRPLSGTRKFVFCNGKGHISRETPGATLRRLGYRGIHTAHGFRTTASTILHEQGYRSDIIERQLAHSERNSVKAAYCHAEYLPERKKMMQDWANFLCAIKDGSANVSLFKKRSG